MRIIHQETIGDVNSQTDLDIDEEFASILNKYGIDINFGILGPIYTFLDVICDSKRHGFTSASKDYSYGDAKRDLQLVINKIERSQIDELELDSKLINKFKSI